MSEIRLCSGKGGHGRLGRVETGLLSRTLPIGTKGADHSTQATARRLWDTKAPSARETDGDGLRLVAYASESAPSLPFYALQFLYWKFEFFA